MMKALKLATALFLLSPWAIFAQEAPAAAPATRPFPKANRGKPVRLPGVIHACDFDEGGEGISYHMVPIKPDPKDPSRQAGQAYRDTGDKLEVAYGTTMIASVRDGEWWTYTVEVREDGIYEVDLVASGWRRGKHAGTIRIEFDGVDLFGVISVPYTGSWKDFSTLTFSGVKLTKGIHKMKVTAVKANDIINLDCYRFRKTVTSPFKGVFLRVPGLVEAEDFSEGPEGLAFHNVDPIKDPNATAGARYLGLQYRKTPVELEKDRGVMMIAAVREGEWQEYLLQVDHDGVYDIDISYSRWDPREKEAVITIDIGGADLYHWEWGAYASGPINLPLTPGGKWNLFGTYKVTGVKLKQGNQTMIVKNVKGQEVINLDSYRFIEEAK